MTTEQEIRKAAAKYARQRDSFEQGPRAELHALIRAARAEGWTLRRIAAVSGLTFARIHQLTKEPAKEG